MNFTLDSYVYAYDATNRKWIEGYQWELQNKTSIQVLNNATQFDEVEEVGSSLMYRTISLIL